MGGYSNWLCHTNGWVMAISFSHTNLPTHRVPSDLFHHQKHCFGHFSTGKEFFSQPILNTFCPHPNLQEIYHSSPFRKFVPTQWGAPSSGYAQNHILIIQKSSKSVNQANKLRRMCIPIPSSLSWRYSMIEGPTFLLVSRKLNTTKSLPLWKAIFVPTHCLVCDFASPTQKQVYSPHWVGETFLADKVNLIYLNRTNFREYLFSRVLIFANSTFSRKLVHANFNL